jgi:glutathione S-transferase
VPYVAGDKYTIADIACFCWVRVSPALLGFNLDAWPAIKKWHDSILQRETVKMALKVPRSKVTEEEFAKKVVEKRRDMEKKVNTDMH